MGSHEGKHRGEGMYAGVSACVFAACVVAKYARALLLAPVPTEVSDLKEHRGTGSYKTESCDTHV